jgi:hypothetical protein
MSAVISVYPDITGHVRPDVRCDVREVPDITSGKNRVKTNISCDITEKTVISQLKSPISHVARKGQLLKTVISGVNPCDI